MIVGLGNPGSKYEKTRHNAGYLALDYFADKTGGKFDSEKMQGIFGSIRLSDRKVYLVKPQTYMNRSGECVAQFSRYFDIAPENILVVHDDLDLNPGRIKIVSGGGAGGHNGIRSTIKHLGTDRFARLKIGIGRPEVMTNNQTIPVPAERFVYVICHLTGH
jgi:PTH1 family peptidyl-tRNA hydrolase